MCFFRKKKGGKVVEAVAEDKAVIQKNLISINKLKVVLDFNAEACGKLDELKSLYEFAPPKDSVDTLKTDKRIAGYLEDIELCAKRAEKGGDFTEIDGLIKKVKVAIAER